MVSSGTPGAAIAPRIRGTIGDQTVEWRDQHGIRGGDGRGVAGRLRGVPGRAASRQPGAGAVELRIGGTECCNGRIEVLLRGCRAPVCTGSSSGRGSCAPVERRPPRWRRPTPRRASLQRRSPVPLRRARDWPQPHGCRALRAASRGAHDCRGARGPRGWAPSSGWPSRPCPARLPHRRLRTTKSIPRPGRWLSRRRRGGGAGWPPLEATRSHR